MSIKALKTFLTAEINDAKDKGVLFSLHMKATMMKVSDPIIFGHAVRLFFADVFEKHQATFDEIGVDANNGYGNILEKVAGLTAEKRQEIEADFANAISNGPDLAMVNSDKGITNLHVPSDVIIDASMPAMIERQDKCGMQKATHKTPRLLFRIVVTQGFIRPPSIFVKKMVLLTPLQWERFQMWDLWLKKQKNMDRMTKLLKFNPMDVSM